MVIRMVSMASEQERWTEDRTSSVPVVSEQGSECVECQCACPCSSTVETSSSPSAGAEVRAGDAAKAVTAMKCAIEELRTKMELRGDLGREA